MGKKAKVGKQRKDVFYHRAKEAGYRARAAYKLIQLNKKYQFLSSSRVCIDLCAAPGSWMQVCTKFMPVSSVIVGVDLYPIPHIPNTISIIGDITTEKVRQALKSNLKTWKADVVLHDGAPNVGQNWLHDAYQQNLLVLHAFKLACEFLQKGGTFITKVFRSKDHLSLEYVFRKLFKKVEATKPIASRFASAEIFVVCQGYLSPDKVDPQFFDAKSVFQGLDPEPKNKIDIAKPEKRKKKAEGYLEGATMLFKKTKISEYIASPNFIDLLEQTNQFEWDSEAAKESDLTTNAIIENTKDIKVLGRKELRQLITWRKNIKKEMEESLPKSETTTENTKQMEGEEENAEKESEEKDEIDEEMEEINKVQKEILELKASQAQDAKQKKKKLEKRKRKLEEKIKLRLMVPGDPGPQELDSGGLFTIKTLNKAPTIDAVVDQDADMMISDEEDIVVRPKKEHYTKDSTVLDESGRNHLLADDIDSDDVNDDESDLNSSDDEGLALSMGPSKSPKNSNKKRVSFTIEEPDEDMGENNPLTTDLVGDIALDRRERKAEKWYSKSMFEEVEDDTLEDYELESAITAHKAKGGVLTEKRVASAFEVDEETGYSSDDSIHDSTEQTSPKKLDGNKHSFIGNKDSSIVDDCPASESDKDSLDSDDTDSESDSESKNENKLIKRKKGMNKHSKLTPVGLALATKMIHSQKAKRDIVDASWNRYMYGDEQLPRFFAESEEKYNSPQIRVDPVDLRMYKERSKDVNVKTIKKAVEAKARKQRRLKKMLARSRKKAETISNNFEMTSREKNVELRKIYKKATNSMKPKDKKYVVMKKSFQGKKPKGSGGQTKMVDRRLKKDKRANAKLEKKRGKKH